MIFCGETLSPGECKWVQIPVPGTHPLECICLCGKNPGQTLVVTAGVHGCEYVGVQALRALAQELDPSTMTGNVILLPLANPYGFYAGAKRVVPEDGVNLNSAFPGDKDGTLGRRLAFALEDSLYPAADFLADLHSGDCNESLHPLVFIPIAGEQTVNSAALEAAKVLSVDYRVRSTARNGLYSRAAQLGIPSLLLERGCRAAWSETELRAELEDLYRLMAHLGMLEESAVRTTQREIRQAVYEEAPCRGFWYPQVQTGAQLSVGQCLGFLTDAEGRMLCEYRAAFDGIVLYHTVILGVQEGDPLIAYGRT